MRCGVDPVAIILGIPAHNEERYIGSVLSKSIVASNKVYVIDDGSTDFTALIAHSFRHVKVLNDSGEESKGYGAAIKRLLGLPLDRHDILVTLDADGQHDPMAAVDVAAPITRGEADISIGSRFLGSAPGLSKSREAAIRAITKTVNATTRYDLTDAQSGYRAYSAKARRLIAPKLTTTAMDTSIEILAIADSLGLKIAEVPITVSHEGEGTSGQDPWTHGSSLFNSLMEAIVHRMLPWLLLLSTLMIFAGTALGAWAVQLYLERHVLISNVALLSTMGIVAGMTVFFWTMNIFALHQIREDHVK